MAAIFNSGTKDVQDSNGAITLASVFSPGIYVIKADLTDLSGVDNVRFTVTGKVRDAAADANITLQETTHVVADGVYFESDTIIVSHSQGHVLEVTSNSSSATTVIWSLDMV